MIVLNHYDPSYPITKDAMFRLWQRSVTLPVRGSSVYALAMLAQEYGIKSRVVVEDLAYSYPNFKSWGYQESDIEIAAYMEALHIRDARASGVVIEERAITMAELDEHAKLGEPLIIRIDSGKLEGPDRPRAHLVPMRYEPDGNGASPYALYDAFRGKIFRFTRPELERCITSLRENCQRDFRMILFSELEC